MIKLVQALSTIHGKPISLMHYEKLAKHLPYPSYEEIKKMLGTWTTLLHMAGIIDIQKESEVYINKLNNDKGMLRTPKKLSHFQSLLFYKQLNDSCITIKKYELFRKQNPNMCSSNTIIKHYGTWREAVKIHNLKTTRRYSEEECICYLLAAQENLKDNFNSSQYSKWAKHNDGPSLSTVLKHCFTWENAVKRLCSF